MADCHRGELDDSDVCTSAAPNCIQRQGDYWHADLLPQLGQQGEELLQLTPLRYGLGFMSVAPVSNSIVPFWT